MSERYPMPEYEYSDVIKAERRPEFKIVTQDELGRTSDLVFEDMTDFWQGTFETYQKKPQKIIEHMNEEASDEIELLETGLPRKLSDAEKDIPEACWHTGQIFSDVYKRRTLDHQYKDARDNGNQAEMKQVALERDDLNVDAAKWQNQLVKIMFNLEKSKQGQDFLKYYWEKFDELGGLLLGNDPEEFKAIKNGIFGLKAAIEILENCGWEAYLAHPEQDAVQKIDLWVKKGNQILAVQNKSRQSNYVLAGWVIASYESTQGVSPDETREINQRNSLLTNALKYDRVFKLSNPEVAVLPYWLELPKSGPEYDQDHTTGKVSLPSGFSTSKFASSLARIGGAK